VADECNQAFLRVMVPQPLVCTAFPADWERYGQRAGPQRNGQMARYCSPGDVCPAFPGGKGMADMLAQARHAASTFWKSVRGWRR
jgi:hypothetical protein